MFNSINHIFKAINQILRKCIKVDVDLSYYYLEYLCRMLYAEVFILKICS